jgi:hypothetical protein
MTSEIMISKKDLLFLKKKPGRPQSKKTFCPAGLGKSGAKARRTKSFFGYFFFKKSNVLLSTSTKL